MLHRKLRAMAVVPTMPASGLPMRLPTNTSSVNDASGSTVAMMSKIAGVGMCLPYHGRLAPVSSFQILRTLHIDRRKVVIEIEKYCQRHRRFGRRQHDH